MLFRLVLIGIILIMVFIITDFVIPKMSEIQCRKKRQELKKRVQKNRDKLEKK